MGWNNCFYKSRLGKISEKSRERQFVLGLCAWCFFALSFCPASAELFFAGLIPLSLKNGGSPLLIPAIYGITALPVIFFASLVAFSAKRVGIAFNKLSDIEKWVQNIAGALFILAGIYYCVNFNFAL